MTSTATFSDVSKLVRCARIPHLRALAWNGETLYASRRYELLRASAADLPRELNWQVVGNFRPSWNRRLSVVNRLTTRLFRDGFHALALLPSGTIVARCPERLPLCGPMKQNSAGPLASFADRGRCTSRQFPAAGFSGESISTMPPAMRYTFTDQPMAACAGMSRTPFPNAPFDMFTTSSTTLGKIAFGC